MVEPRSTRNFKMRGHTMRVHAARGTIINAVFLILFTFLGFLKGLILAGFLDREDYGIWGIVLIGIGTLSWLKQVGISDQYIRQEDPDQERAFQLAFTLELIFTALLCTVMLALLPLVVIAYGQPDVLLPGLVLIACLPAVSLQSPLWIYYRDMDFLRQRLLQGIDPVVGLIVGVALAAAGQGYWALVLSVLAGSWASALFAVVASPYRLRLVYERGTARKYLSFSWPLLGAALMSLVLAQASLMLPNIHLGLAAVGAITLAATITQFTDRVDKIITGTLYPAICAVQDRTELLFETFVKSNRIALMWAFPFGIGLALFAPDLVHYALGDRWEPAIGVLQVFGATAAFGHIAFNWDAYFRARGETRPILVASIVSAVTFFAVGVPGLLLGGLVGFAFGWSAQVAAHVVCRAYFLSRLFDGFAMTRHIVRAIAPSAIPVAAVLLFRAVDGSERTGGLAAVEFGLYLLLTVVATLTLERALLREAVGYVRGRSSPLTSA